MTTTEKKRSKPYIWPTWITGLLSGEKQCRYSAWYRAHHLFAKLPDDDFDSDAWNAQHTAMVTAIAERLTRRGYTVGVEETNSFALHGKTATLSGKPDIVATNDDEAIIVDAKGGKPKPEHHWQVKIYMWAMPLVERALAPMMLRGELEYRAPMGVVPVTIDAVDVDKITRTIRMVGSDVAPAATPSPAECRYCNIAACDYRHKSAKPREANVSTF